MASIGQTIAGPRFHETDEARVLTHVISSAHVWRTVVRPTEGLS
jgi:hypothetical protein